MSDATTQKQRYMVGIYDPEDASGALTFTFVPEEQLQENGHITAPRRVPAFIVKVKPKPNGFDFDWSGTPDDPGPERNAIEVNIQARMNDRAVWIQRVSSLVDLMEQWAAELHWSTRRVEKKLDDAWIGKHRLPALLMQEDTCRVLLEPVGRSTPGAEGVVDLYLMPAYDDIATLYYYGNCWNLHYLSPGGPAVATVRDAAATPLTKETLEKVLAEMRQNAV